MIPSAHSFIAFFASSFLATSSAMATPPTSEHVAPPAPVPGKAEVTMRCLICHGDTQAGQQRLAPPMVMVKRRYMQATEDAFVKEIAQWVKKPSADKSKFPGAIRRFNLMPTFQIPENEVKLIAQYIYKTEFKFPSSCGTGGPTGKAGKGGKNAASGCDESDCPQPVKSKGGKKTATGCDESDCTQPAESKG